MKLFMVFVVNNIHEYWRMFFLTIYLQLLATECYQASAEYFWSYSKVH